MRLFQIGLGVRGTRINNFFIEDRGLAWRYIFLLFSFLLLISTHTYVAIQLYTLYLVVLIY